MPEQPRSETEDIVRSLATDERRREVPPDEASWGSILTDASQLYDVAWWLMLFPGAFLIITTLAFNLLGDGLRDAFDVRAER